jgi:membrane protein YdbS with pleckstrin-like domain
VQRKFELATLIVHTAGTENASVILSGLPHGAALQIRDYLIDVGTEDAV